MGNVIKSENNPLGYLPHLTTVINNKDNLWLSPVINNMYIIILIYNIKENEHHSNL